MKFYKLFLYVFLCLFSCTKETEIFDDKPLQSDLTVDVSVEDFTFASNTKSTTPDAYSFSFQADDRIGIIPYVTSGTSNTAQLPLIIASGVGGDEASFTTGLGWSLIDNGRFKYVAYFPYSSNCQSGGLPIDFTTQEQSLNGNTDHLKEYDILYSNAVSPDNPSTASFRMQHLCALVQLNITVPSEYGAAMFKQLTLRADDEVFVKKGVCSFGGPFPSFDADSYSNTLSLKMSSITPTDNIITAYLMMFPADLSEQNVEVILYTDKNKKLTGKISSPSAQEGGRIYTHNANVVGSSTPSYLPDKPREGETLNILLIGHSFGVDATEYLPSMLKEAGIDNVKIGRFYYPNCFLKRHYEYYLNETSYTYFQCDPGNTKYTSSSRTLKSVVEQTRWDLIVFQQATEVQASDPEYGPGSTEYSTYQPYLNDLIQMLTDETIEHHDIIPFIGWHMFWGYGSGSGYSTMYNKIKAATQAMQLETGIQILIPSGQAVDNARACTIYDITPTIYGESDYSHHCCRGVGRYLTACTWFESLIKPIYGVSVVGNTFRMTEKMSGESDAPEGRRFNPVDDTNAPILQRCAEAAVKHPFEVTHIEE